MIYYKIIYFLSQRGNPIMTKKEFIYAMQKGLGSRRMLTDDLLQECLYDSNSEIRKYGGS